MRERQNDDKYVSYLRVSTQRQGKSGLGKEAQRAAVQNYLGTYGWELLGEYVEVESGRKNDRPKLQEALEHCKREGATLIIAKLDRLSRNAAFLLSLRDSGVEFRACDLPEADRFTVGILALVAEREAELISERTREALAAAKRRGVKLGNPSAAQVSPLAVEAHKRKADEFAKQIKPFIDEIRDKGNIETLQGIADALNARGIKTARGGKWWATTVKNVLDKI